MRTARLLLGLLLTVTAAACAGGNDDGKGVATAQSGNATAAAGPSTAAAGDAEAPLKFARCMREQGLTWFPDPDTNGRTHIKMPKGVTRQQFEAAEEACKEFAPGRDAGGPADPAMLEQVRQMAKCMRANGVPDFPDPQSDGSIQIERGKIGMEPDDPAFKKAEQKCAQYRPQPAGPAT